MAEKAAKFLSVGRGGVHAMQGKVGDTTSSISGYIGHDWTDDVGPDTIGMDTRTIPDDDIWRIAISGPILDVDLPPNSISCPYEKGLREWDGETLPRSLDSVSIDVWVKIYEAAGAIVYRTPEAVAQFAASISNRN